MFEQDIIEDIVFLKDLGLTNDEIQGYIDFFEIKPRKNKKVINYNDCEDQNNV